MKKFSFVIFIIVVIVAVGVWFSLNEDSTKTDTEFNIIDTAGSLSDALQKANNTDKKVFAVFESDTCVYCKQLRQNTLNDNQVMEKLMKVM